jgi:hypothetical protein
MTALQLPAAAAIEIGMGTDPTLHGVRWDWGGSDLSMLFLHGQGGDVDDLRWLADGVVAAGISVLGIDLPGHGLSDGELPELGGKAIRAALTELGRETPGVTAVLAQGESAGLLLQTDPPVTPAGPPVAAILLDPRPGFQPRPTGQHRPPQDRPPQHCPPQHCPPEHRPSRHCAPSWRLVPKLLLVPADTEHQAFATEVIESTNAWTLRADLHGFAGRERTRQQTQQRTESAEIQLTSIVLKFVLELAAYELAGRRAGLT